MRSLIFALALAAPLSAVAATPMYSNPLNSMHHAKEQPVVFLTFVNFTVEDREVLVGDVHYHIHYNSVMHVYAPVGSVVRVFSDQNSKVSGQLMQVSANDADRSIILK